MRHSLAIFVLFFVSVTYVAAYQLSVTDVTTPYEIIPISGDPEIKQVYLGELENFPIMYEVTATEPFTLTTQIAQRYQGGGEPAGLSLMIIRVNDGGRGVTEVVRQHSEVKDWTIQKDSLYGMSFWLAPEVNQEVGPGTYRIEVSTPENLSKYKLIIGRTDVSVGYFETLGQVYTIQKFFGYSPLKMLTSSYVYYPLGVLLLLFVIHRTWKYRKTITGVT